MRQGSRIRAYTDVFTACLRSIHVNAVYNSGHLFRVRGLYRSMLCCHVLPT